MGSSAMWYKKGNFYEVPTTHINFFLSNPELLGFTQEEKQQLCIENGIPADATDWLDTTQERSDILLEVLRRGAIRIRFYGGKTSVQCYDHNNKMNYRELQNCIIDGYGKCFGSIITVMDTLGWGEMINDMGWGMQIKDFIAASLHKPQWNYINSVKENGYDRNNTSLNSVFGKDRVYSASYNRMKSYMYDHETVTLTADKSQRNESNYNGEYTNKELENALRTGLQELCFDRGWKVFPVYGGFQGAADKSKENNENSYMIVNMNDDPDFRNVMNDFMREFDDNFSIPFKQESIMYSPALGTSETDNVGNVRRSFDSQKQGEWDYPSTGAPSDKLGSFRDKAKGVARDNNGNPEGYFYTRPRRNKSHSFAFGDDYVKDR
jgi:hypothetical protein